MIALQTLAQPRSSSALPARPESPDRLRQLERLVWRYGNAMPAAGETTRATGFAELDRALPQHGWFADGLNELLGNEQGAGEFSLLLPALAQACADGKSVVLVNPPFLPYAPALANAGVALAHLIVVRNADSEQLYWAAEQALRSKACGAVVAWSDESARLLPDLTLRRLQMAAHAGTCPAFLFRPRRAREQASPAPLRIVYAPAQGALELVVHKCRGLSGQPRVRVQAWRHAWAMRPLKPVAPAPVVAPRYVHDAVRADTSARVQPRQRPPSPHNSGDPNIRAGCIEAGSGPWRGHAQREKGSGSDGVRLDLGAAQIEPTRMPARA
jgi:cell division inhibitor SulA/protein ImuA